MTRSESLSFDSALQQLCSPDWVPGSSHPTRHLDGILLALLPASRTDEGRAALGATSLAIPNLVAILRDPLVFHEPLGELAIRLLRNLCARSVANQGRTAQCAAHDLVLDCIEKRFEFCDTQQGTDDKAALRRVEEVAGEDHRRMKMPFFGYAVEFLVNFATCNAHNAELVWNRAFPKLLGKLLECENHAAAAAAAGLIHNCIAVVPERMLNVVETWADAKGEDMSITRSLVQQMKNAGATQEEDDQFSWSFMIIRRLIGASLLENCFEALGPPLLAIASGEEALSEPQETFLKILDAAVSKSAECPAEDDIATVAITESSLDFFGELFETAFLTRNGNLLAIAGSILGAVIILGEDSAKLDSLRLKAISVAIKVLHGISAAPNGTTTSQGVGDIGAPLEMMQGTTAGLRGVMVRTVAVCCDGSRDAQDAVRRLDGIPLILSSLSYESDVRANPFLREWGILAVRNLTMENAENVAEISSYELHSVQHDSEFLEKAGLEAYMDPETGRPKVRMRAEQGIPSEA